MTTLLLGLLSVTAMASNTGFSGPYGVPDHGVKAPGSHAGAVSGEEQVSDQLAGTAASAVDVVEGQAAPGHVADPVGTPGCDVKRALQGDAVVQCSQSGSVSDCCLLEAVEAGCDVATPEYYSFGRGCSQASEVAAAKARQSQAKAPGSK